MSEKDSTNSDRFFESLFYGHPMSSHVRTPDGRVLIELDKHGRADTKRHEELMTVQGELVRTLREANRGAPTISRDDFHSRSAELLPAFREAAERIQGLHQTQADLLNESRVLTQIASEGFDSLCNEVAGVRTEVRGVRSDLAGMETALTGAISESTRTMQGPALPAESLTNLVNRGHLFFEALSAYTKGILAPHAQREVEALVDSRLRSPAAKASAKRFIEQKVEEEVAKMREENSDQEDERGWESRKRRLKADVLLVTSIIDHPREFLTSPAVAQDKLATLQRLLRVFHDAPLEDFVKNAIGICTLIRKAKGASLPGDFLVDLTNSGLVTDGVSHEVKHSNRGARLAGTAVDRNYNLMELLEQGDYAKGQRAKLVELAERHLAVGEVGVGQRKIIIAQGHLAAAQRGELIDQGRHAVDQRDELIEVGVAGLVQGQHAASQRETLVHQGEELLGQQIRLVQLGTSQLLVGLASLDRLTDIDESVRSVDGNITRVVSSLAEANDHLVNLENLGARFIDAVDYGFQSVNDSLVGGFNLVADGLDQVAIEIAVSKAAIVGQLGQINRSLDMVGARIVDEVAYGNRILDKLLVLQEESLRNVAQQRLKQGAFFLKNAKTSEDFREAREIFQRGVDEDPTILEGQYGLGVAAEGMGDIDEAKRRFRNVGRLAGKDKDELAIGAWLKFAKQEQASGDLPSAIEATRQALQRDDKNSNLRLDLARLLALGGLEEEAEEILFSLIEGDPEILFQLKLEPTFSPGFLVRVYKKIWSSGGTTKGGLKTVIFLFEELSALGEKDFALFAFKHLMKGGPRLILKYDVLNTPGLSNILPEVKAYIISILNSDTDLFAAEDWYAMTSMALNLELDLKSILKSFERGLKHDSRYQRGENEHLSKLVEAIRLLDPTFNLPTNQ